MMSYCLTANAIFLSPHCTNIITCTGIEFISIGKNLRLFEPNFSTVIFNSPSLKHITFREGRESLDGYAFFSTTSPVSVDVPASVNVVSGYTFFNYSTMTITFAGDCPEMENEEWYGNVIVRYNPDMVGWDNCDWSSEKGTLTLEPIQ